ncbi:MAG: OmpA family protein [Proteobacteria bacterium]|nr:OmpA family protein [Pseudomonadota bacterium]
MAEENQEPNGDGTEDPIEDAVEQPEVTDDADAEEPKKKKKKPLECPACEAGAPAWMATFADMATLLMAFFVLILSFTEMEDPSITKMLEGTMTDAFGVQRRKPSTEAPMGQTIIAQQYKTTKAPAGTEAKEDTTTEEPEERELEDSPDVSQSETLTDIENLERTFATEIAAGKVSLEEKDGKITVSVNENTDSNDRDETGSQNNDGQLDREELEIFAKVAESQAFMETELEVEYLTSDSEDEMLRQTRKTQELDDKYQALRADLSSEIQQGLANVEKIGDQILISLSAANSVRSGYAELQPAFSDTLRNVGDSVARAGGNVQVSGHTDDIPIAFSERFDSNWDLSAARAAAVADFFFANNQIDSERVSVFGYADTKPVADNGNAAGRAQNRRIEILIDG